MIVLNLVCDSGHQFEGWFASVDSFDEQVARRLVTCPKCNATGIERLPAAPHVARSRSDNGAQGADHDETRKLIERLCELADASEDVGSRFPDEARRIHNKEAAARPIRGLATLSDTKELLEEGIQVLPVPDRPLGGTDHLKDGRKPQ